MSHPKTHRLIWVAAALVLTVSLSACGKSGAVAGGVSTPSTSPAATAAPAQTVADAARAYLIARDQAVVAGTRPDQLSEWLQPGSPVAAVEPLVARGRSLVAARQGTLTVSATTRVSLGSVAFFQGAEPVTASHIAFSSDAVTRAEVVCRTSSRLTTADAAEQTIVADHVLTLVAGATGTWLVYEDDYVDPQQAEALAAAGAPSWQVSAAHQRVRDLARVRRASSSAAGAVRVFVSLLEARRYVEAGFCLGPGFGGTARAMGATLRAIRLVGAVPSGLSSPIKAVLRATLRVQPRLALWTAGLNVRFITLERGGTGDPWRIVAIDTGP
jgi:hypothetical protein